MPISFSLAAAVDQQKGSTRIALEVLDRGQVFPEQAREIVGRAVPTTQPNDLRRRAVEEAALLGIGILGSDHEAILRCVVPHSVIACSRQTNVAHVSRLGVDVGD